MEVNNPVWKFGVTRNAPVGYLKESKTVPYADAASCETAINIGIFFDGTGNSLAPQGGMSARSNVARLRQTYPNLPNSGSHQIYIPGLGTPFPLIGEKENSMLGSAFARGGDSRIAYALLGVYNAIHRSLFNTHLFGPQLAKALCCASPSKVDLLMLKNYGMTGNLIDDDGGVRRKKFLSECAKSIQDKAKVKQAPKICECAIDVFGFSRGATEARVFCHWLNDLLTNSKLAGIPLRFRFLGVMETVASVGIWEGIKNDQTHTTGGHSGWATPEMMRILPAVENCVHLVAMHELRKNFPLDTVSINQKLPPNCIEFAYPGSHSDVGGGYAIGELGVSPSDSLKLSQITLNHMFDCAVVAGVPLSTRLLLEADRELFDVHHDLKTAFDQFLSSLSETPRTLADWALPYLVWRWQTRLVYHQKGQAVSATQEDRGYLLGANQQFCWLADLMRDYAVLKKKPPSKQRSYDRDGSQITLAALEPEAPALRDRVAAHSVVDPKLAAFFDNFVHDSLAGFRKQLVEPTGHWRYRRVFHGTATPYT